MCFAICDSRCCESHTLRVVCLDLSPFPLKQERAPHDLRLRRLLFQSLLRGRIETRSLQSCLLLTANDGNERRDWRERVGLFPNNERV